MSNIHCPSVQQTQQRWRAVASLCIAIIFSCFSSGDCAQVASQNVRLNLHVMLKGGSTDVPKHLPGDLQVRADAVEFAAYPQFYNVSWSCNDLRKGGAV